MVSSFSMSSLLRISQKKDSDEPGSRPSVPIRAIADDRARQRGIHPASFARGT